MHPQKRKLLLSGGVPEADIPLCGLQLWSLNFYRNLMKRDVPVDRNKTAPKCRQCCYYHPDFKYRKCLFSTCPYGKQDKDIFRRKPLSKDRFSIQEVVI